MKDPPQAPDNRIRSFFQTDPPEKLAVAVSGGSDSLGLLMILKEWRDEGGPDLSAVTVDHGLRPEAAAEAQHVADLCSDWRVPHTILAWRPAVIDGNLSDQARRARYALMGEWAVANDAGAVTLGHTLDDQAETFLMRLARAAGVDGLSAMASRWEQNGVYFVRPALQCRRAELQDVLRSRSVPWVDDPSNSDPAYDRTRARAAVAALEPLGIDAATLADVAGHMTDARITLHALMIKAARGVARAELGDVLIDPEGFQGLEPELARRMMQASMRWVSGAEYPPRGASLDRVLQSLSGGQNMTLQGCQIVVSKNELRITREANAVANHQVSQGDLWDGRWRLMGPKVKGAHIAALGEGGLALCPDRAESPLPAVSLKATPALWQGDTLVAAPLAGLENGYSAKLLPRGPHDFAALITH